MDSPEVVHLKAGLFDLLRQMEVLERRKTELLYRLDRLEHAQGDPAQSQDLQG